MGRAFGLIMMLGAMYLGMQIYADGIDRVWGGVFAPIESSDRNSSRATHLSPAAQLADEPSSASRPRERLTERIRRRVTADLEAGASRYEDKDF